MRYRYWITFAASVVLALVFLTSGVGKLLGQSAFLLALTTLIVDPQFVNFVAHWLPWVELVLGVCLLVGIVPQLVAGFSIMLIGAFIGYNTLMIRHGFASEPCECLGILDRVLGGELSTIDALYIDIGLIILALVIYFCYPGKFLNVRPWFFKRGRMAEGVGNDSTEDSAEPKSLGELET